MIKCNRCGYVYDPNASKAVIQMIGEDGTLYVACENCIELIALVETEEEKNAIMESFKEE